MLILVGLLGVSSGLHLEVFLDAQCGSCPDYLGRNLLEFLRQPNALQGIDFSLVPFSQGSFYTLGETTVFNCLRGADECYEEAAYACVLRQAQYELDALKFITCVNFVKLNSNDTEIGRAVEKCAFVAKLTADDILTCARGQQGSGYLLDFAKQTGDLPRRVEPVLRINGQVIEDDSINEFFFRNMTGFLCEKFAVCPDDLSAEATPKPETEEGSRPSEPQIVVPQPLPAPAAEAKPAETNLPAPATEAKPAETNLLAPLPEVQPPPAPVSVELSGPIPVETQAASDLPPPKEQPSAEPVAIIVPTDQDPIQPLPPADAAPTSANVTSPSVSGHVLSDHKDRVQDVLLQMDDFLASLNQALEYQKHQTTESSAAIAKAINEGREAIATRINQLNDSKLTSLARVSISRAKAETIFLLETAQRRLELLSEEVVLLSQSVATALEQIKINQIASEFKIKPARVPAVLREDPSPKNLVPLMRGKIAKDEEAILDDSKVVLPKEKTLNATAIVPVSNDELYARIKALFN